MLSKETKQWVDDYLITDEWVYPDMGDDVLLDLENFSSHDGLYALTELSQNILENKVEFKKYVQESVEAL